MEKVITPAEASTLLEKEPTAVYLDVRTEEEFAQGHPRNAINIPLLHRSPAGMEPNPDFLTVAKQFLSLDRTILCGCQMGGRSSRAASALSAAGFKDVRNVLGGWGGGPGINGEHVSGWREQGLPVDEQNEPAHSYQGIREKVGL